jgi:VanZ family protein
VPADSSGVHARFLEILQRCSGHGGHRIRPVGSRRLAAPHGPRLADRARPRLLRGHVDCLPRLAQTTRGRASSHGWCSMLLEGLQALTPDRHANFLAGLYGAGGALAAALLAELFTRTWRWRTPLKTLKIIGGLVLVAFAVLSLVPRQLRPHTGLPGPLEHMAAYAIAGALLTVCYQKRSQPFIVAVALSLYAATLEIAQIWVPGRNPKFIDFAASSAGALIALLWLALGFLPNA